MGALFLCVCVCVCVCVCCMYYCTQNVSHSTCTALLYSKACVCQIGVNGVDLDTQPYYLLAHIQPKALLDVAAHRQTKRPPPFLVQSRCVCALVCIRFWSLLFLVDCWLLLVLLPNQGMHVHKHTQSQPLRTYSYNDAHIMTQRERERSKGLTQTSKTGSTSPL